MTYSHDELILKNGGRREFWVAQAAVVARFIETKGAELTRVQVVATPAAAGAPAAPMAAVAHAAAARVLAWDPTRGGMRTPHLHHGGEIYVLNEGQWADFSKGAVTVLAERMGKAQKVSFEAVMELSDAVAGM